MGLRAKISCWVLSEVIFWPKWSFCNWALLRFFMHMETHFSTISFYLNLQIKNFFKMARLIYISIYFYNNISDNLSICQYPYLPVYLFTSIRSTYISVHLRKQGLKHLNGDWYLFVRSSLLAYTYVLFSLETHNALNSYFFIALKELCAFNFTIYSISS